MNLTDIMFSESLSKKYTLHDSSDTPFRNSHTQSMMTD